jgi:hypothetical protein
MTYQEFDSIFYSQGVAYNLNKIFAITADIPTVEFEIGDLQRLLTMNSTINTQTLQKIDWQRVAQADLQYPIIISQCSEGLIIVDGMHRYIKAITNGQNITVKTIYITPEELETTRICA